MNEELLVCPTCARVTEAVYPPRCAHCGWTGTVDALMRSGRTRPRQFRTYPEAYPWRMR